MQRSLVSRAGYVVLAFAMSFHGAGRAGEAAEAEPREVTVEVTGEAWGEGGNALDRAREDAFVKAVEKGAGVFIRRQTRTEGYDLIYDVTLRKSAGYVKSYRELKKEVKNDMTFLTIKALVAVGDFRDQWEDFALLLKRKGSPRFMVLIDERQDGRPTFVPVATPVVEKFFLGKRLPMVDATQVKAVRAREKDLASLAADPARAAALAQRLRADYVIVGQVEAKSQGERTIHGVKFHTCVTQSALKVVVASNGRLLSAEPTRAKASETEKDTAADKAMKQAVTKPLSDIFRQIAQTWLTEIDEGQKVELVVEKADFGQADALCEFLREQKGVTDVQLREVLEAGAYLDVATTLKTMDLARLLSKCPNPQLRVTRAAAGKIRAAVR